MITHCTEAISISSERKKLIQKAQQKQSLFVLMMNSLVYYRLHALWNHKDMQSQTILYFKAITAV